MKTKQQPQAIGSIVASPFGPFYIAERDGLLVYGSFGDPMEGSVSGGSDVLRWAKEEFEAYFAGRLREFSVPYSLFGTAFQKAVWEALKAIAYGETKSYSQIAREIDRPKAQRAVGMANHANPISILIPCHRVIAKDGSLCGYGGGVDKKEALLALEARVMQGEREKSLSGMGR